MRSAAGLRPTILDNPLLRFWITICYVCVMFDYIELMKKVFGQWRLAMYRTTFQVVTTPCRHRTLSMKTCSWGIRPSWESSTFEVENLCWWVADCGLCRVKVSDFHEFSFVNLHDLQCLIPVYCCRLPCCRNLGVTVNDVASPYWIFR